MKNLNIFMAVTFVAAFAFSSCDSNNKEELPKLTSEIDSLNYAFGVANGDGIKSYYLKDDTTNTAIKSLLEGLKDGMKGDIDPKYAELSDLGTKIGSSLKEQEKSGLMGDSTLKVNIELVKQGLVNGLKGSSIQMTPAAAQDYVNTTMKTLQEKKMAEQFAPNKKAGELFLAENAKKAGVITTASGLQYEIIKKGTGSIPTINDKVKVHYHGTLIDGSVFDSSVERKEPITFPVTGVIKGWTEALQLMPVGSKYKIYVPQNLAYAEADRGQIKPFSMLIFEVELLSIEK